MFAVKNVEKTTIHSVNGMFVEKLIPLRTAFLANVKKYYNSDVVHVDFEHGGYAATNYINKYSHCPLLFMTNICFYNLLCFDELNSA